MAPMATTSLTPKTTVAVPLAEVGLETFRAATDPDWTPQPLRLEVKLRDSTPPRP